MSAGNWLIGVTVTLFLVLTAIGIISWLVEDLSEEISGGD